MGARAPLPERQDVLATIGAFVAAGHDAPPFLTSARAAAVARTMAARAKTMATFICSPSAGR